MYNLGDMECNWLHNLYIIYSLYEPTKVGEFIGRFVDQLLLK